MARINIEDEIYKDMRFIQLMQKLGSVDAALGALVRAWSLAQKYFLSTETDRLIPLFEWKRQMIPDSIIDVGLAERREQGIYICGAEKQFAWLIQRQDAGKKGGRPKSEPEENITTVITEETGRLTTESDRLSDESGAKRLEPSYSYSSSFSSSEELNLKNLKANSRAKRAPPPGMGLFIATYAKAFEARWKSRPDLRGKVQGQIKTFLADTPIERACELIQVYCQMEEPWFVTKCHDFGTFLENIGKVNIALDTGQLPGHSDPLSFLTKDMVPR